MADTENKSEVVEKESTQEQKEEKEKKVIGEFSYSEKKAPTGPPVAVRFRE